MDGKLWQAEELAGVFDQILGSPGSFWIVDHDKYKVGIIAALSELGSAAKDRITGGGIMDGNKDVHSFTLKTITGLEG